MFETIVYAEPAATDAAAATASSGTFAAISQIAIFLGVIVLLYFMMIRPQKKREQKTKEMLANLAVGDKVVSIGGICGKITKIKDQYVILETGSTGNPNEKSFIKMERSSIREIEKKGEASDKKPELPED